MTLRDNQTKKVLVPVPGIGNHSVTATPESHPDCRSRLILIVARQPSEGGRMFVHPDSEWYIEFPSGPLGFGDTYVDARKIPMLTTKYGPIRIITPTLCVIDRLAAYWYHFDRQAWDQAIEVAKRQDVDWNYVYSWAKSENRPRDEIDKLRALSVK